MGSVNKQLLSAFYLTDQPNNPKRGLVGYWVDGVVWSLKELFSF